jgi:hypothetical protein
MSHSKRKHLLITHIRKTPRLLFWQPAISWKSQRRIARSHEDLKSKCEEPKYLPLAPPQMGVPTPRMTRIGINSKCATDVSFEA